MIAEQLAAYFEQCFTMPVLPSTLLVLLIVAYGALVILGALDFDLLDFDVDIDADADVGAISSAGFVTLKFFNIGEVPLMVWLCIYGLLWWAISQVLWMAMDRTSVDPNTTLLVVRNVAASVMLTKFATSPLAKIFSKPPKFRPGELVGQECEITTHQATTEFGQAKYQTDAAPLLLDVKMSEGVLAKGDPARIIDYDPDSKIHYLAAVSDPP